MTRSQRLYVALAAGLIGGAALLVRFGDPLVRLRPAIERFSLELQAFMSANWLAFGLGQVVVAASGVLPASLIAVIAGATYGLGAGLVISAVSTMVGGWVAFAVCRTAMRTRIERWMLRYPSLARLDQAITTESWRFVLLLRVSPVMPFALTSYGLGLTRISQRDFLVGTMASLPALAGYVALGALGKQGMILMINSASPLHWIMLVAGIATVVYALMRVRKVLAKVGQA